MKMELDIVKGSGTILLFELQVIYCFIRLSSTCIKENAVVTIQVLRK